MSTADKDDAARRAELPTARSQSSHAGDPEESDEASPNDGGTKQRAATIPARELLPLPGLGAIALYLLTLSGVIILGVVGGGHYPKTFLSFRPSFWLPAPGCCSCCGGHGRSPWPRCSCSVVTTSGFSRAFVRRRRWFRACSILCSSSIWSEAKFVSGCASPVGEPFVTDSRWL